MSHRLTRHAVPRSANRSTTKEIVMPSPAPPRSGRPRRDRNPLALIAKPLLGAALAAAVATAWPATAGADPDPGGAANPFGGLSCGCSGTRPAGDPAQIDHGLRQGLSDGRPASSPERSPG
ncbi:hypothetical protein BB734_20600 [Mycobacterium avium subsp. hominissuis]|uniref:Uncharacterized protein n=3 Tax=Mycobacterium avium complex (MAC) TaxID=120793 RepID=A0A2A3LER0_MYCAV|nr:hypothetical protein BS641_14550 [Mycobacterium avium subsp. hominissuis]ETZ41727.1 hypothetical protein L838_4629 [Mycobacterium avium MAV_120709_2344]ETZ74851.1 hypothetical protein L841_0447 [Mycobacterium sp. MAC_080597_8934]ORB77615.1 hypothetical protein BST46_23590 [Mycobacterium timonense]PBA10918.1 hypothetical protein CKJ70_12295 [Mycobacterium avium]